MELEDFLVMIGLKLLVKRYLENTLRYTTPFKNSENSVMTQALIYLRGLTDRRKTASNLVDSRNNNNILNASRE